MIVKCTKTTLDVRAVVPLAALWLVFVVTAVLGGNSREDFPGLIVLYPFVVLAAAAAVLTTRQIDWTRVSAQLAVLGALAAIALFQLMPLPESVWSMLPERSQWTAGSRAAGVMPGWLPLSISPSLTLDALVSLIVPSAFLVAIASVPRRQARHLVWAVLGAMLMSAVFGAAQYAAGGRSIFSIHPFYSLGEASGLFANRNHQALFLALAPPIASIVLTTGETARRHAGAALMIFTGLSVLIALTVLMTGSRAGTITFAIGLVLAVLTIWRGSSAFERLRQQASGSRILIAGACALAAAFFFVLSSGRMVAIERLTAGDIGSDLRWRTLPTLIDIWSHHWAFGSGLGTFDPLYRIYEPLDLLSQSYLNHAHNDLLEMAICGGIPALLVLSIFGLWLTCRIADALKTSDAYAIAASICVLQILGASIFDYPLRTPLIAMIFVLVCVWLPRQSGSKDESSLPSEGRRLEKCCPVQTD